MKSSHVAAGPEDADLPSASVVVLHMAPEAALGDWKPDRTVAVDISATAGAPGRKANAEILPLHAAG